MRNFQILIVSVVKICKQCLQTDSVSGGDFLPRFAPGHYRLDFLLVFGLFFRKKIYSTIVSSRLFILFIYANLIIIDFGSIDGSCVTTGRIVLIPRRLRTGFSTLFTHLQLGMRVFMFTVIHGSLCAG